MNGIGTARGQRLQELQKFLGGRGGKTVEGVGDDVGLDSARQMELEA